MIFMLHWLRRILKEMKLYEHAAVSAQVGRNSNCTVCCVVLCCINSRVRPSRCTHPQTYICTPQCGTGPLKNRWRPYRHIRSQLHSEHDRHCMWYIVRCLSVACIGFMPDACIVCRCVSHDRLSIPILIQHSSTHDTLCCHLRLRS